MINGPASSDANMLLSIPKTSPKVFPTPLFIELQIRSASLAFVLLSSHHTVSEILSTSRRCNQHRLPPVPMASLLILRGDSP